jgi:D-lactate dehydrogenase
LPKGFAHARIGRMNDVFFYEAFAEEAEALRRYLPSSIAAGFTGDTIQEAGHMAPPARLISLRTQSVIPTSWADSLDGILSRSTGYDHLLAYAASVPRCPALGHLPLYCHRAVAEQAALLWLALLRRLPVQLRQFTTFHRDTITGAECQGRTLAVVGVGNIGREVCRVGAALGMRVLGVDLLQKHDDIQYVDIDTALAQADVVVAAMNLNASNRGYFNADRLARCKRGAIFVNIARGELSPSTALLAALRAGLLGGIGLDVYDHEPELAETLRGGQPSHDPEVLATLELTEYDNVICTPHNAFNSDEAVQRKSEHSIRQIVAFLETGQFEWPVPVRG